jgi:hypothetical protein
MEVRTSDISLLLPSKIALWDEHIAHRQLTLIAEFLNSSQNLEHNNSQIMHLALLALDMVDNFWVKI